MSDEAAAVSQQKVLGDAPQALSQQDQEKNAAASDYKAKQLPDDELNMAVRISSPFKEYYDGAAFSISAENATGPFDILPRHHNFISLLSACEIVVRTIDKNEQRIKISGGIMHVKADKVVVFLDV